MRVRVRVKMRVRFRVDSAFEKFSDPRMPLSNPVVIPDSIFLL